MRMTEIRIHSYYNRHGALSLTKLYDDSRGEIPAEK
jgi:hypothetical protein